MMQFLDLHKISQNFFHTPGMAYRANQTEASCPSPDGSIPQASSDIDLLPNQDMNVITTTPQAPKVSPTQPSRSPAAMLSSSIEEALPSTVRGAPEALKPAIRKKQNKAAAQRCRKRRTQVLSQLEMVIETVFSRLRSLEERIAQVERFLAASGLAKGDERTLNQVATAGISKSTADMTAALRSLMQVTRVECNDDSGNSQSQEEELDQGEEIEINSLIHECLDPK